MTAQIINMNQYKQKLNYESRVIRDIDTDEVICELPSPIIDMAIYPEAIYANCEDGKQYRVFPDGSFQDEKDDGKC